MPIPVPKASMGRGWGDIHMQNNRVPQFVNRTICYACKAIVAQRDQLTTKPKADRYRLVPIYTVCFMNFFPKEDDEVKHFKTDVMLREEDGRRM